MFITGNRFERGRDGYSGIHTLAANVATQAASFDFLTTITLIDLLAGYTGAGTGEQSIVVDATAAITVGQRIWLWNPVAFNYDEITVKQVVDATTLRVSAFQGAFPDNSILSSTPPLDDAFEARLAGKMSGGTQDAFWFFFSNVDPTAFTEADLLTLTPGPVVPARVDGTILGVESGWVDLPDALRARFAGVMTNDGETMNASSDLYLSIKRLRRASAFAVMV